MFYCETELKKKFSIVCVTFPCKYNFVGKFLFIIFSVLFIFVIFTRTGFAITNPSVVCLSSIKFVHPAQLLETFGNVSSPFCTLAIL